MGILTAVLVIVVLVALSLLAMAVRIVKQYEQGVLFRTGPTRGRA